MSSIRYDLIYATNNKATILTDTNIHNDIHKQFKFQQQMILADKLLTKDEKTEALKLLNKNYDRDKILNNSGTKRICENCNQECLATLYCEYCVRNYLKANFSKWTSGNNDIDNLIRKCQMETLLPSKIVEWIPYNNLENIKYLTKGGCSEIYTADWISGRYDEWDSREQQLIKTSSRKVILKKLENVESANQKINKDGNIETNYTSSRLFTSKVYQFENLPEPKNATEAFHSKPYNYKIPDNIDDFNKSSSYTFGDNSENDSSKEFNELQINSKNDDQVDYNEVIIPQQVKKRHVDIDDEDEIYNNPNLHSEEQDEFEIPDELQYLNLHRNKIRTDAIVHA
ncbi:hypothetical protein C1645_808377 [Glomus cerebriforme]|uniref:Uncharacterized protein n=1 Tax=Glomus cerebriforme TaxID=658196 RepID=A0A397SG76_9GLOM|nr:hypothetical protein C1645_808377 [Glomus cerebriforme]